MTEYGQTHQENGPNAIHSSGKSPTHSIRLKPTFWKFKNLAKTLSGDFGDNLRTSGPKTLSNTAFDRKLKDESNAFFKISPR